ncbi:MAG: hypothetical protein AAFO69_19980 [Bacteroidota bacterium]
MLLKLFLVLWSFSSGSMITSEVKLVDNSSVCELSYAYPQNVSGKQLQYRTVGSASWSDIQSSLDEVGFVTLDSLESDKLYECRLGWTEGATQVFSQIHYFRTFEALQSQVGNFDSHVIILPTDEPENKVHTLYQTQISFEYQDQYDNDEGNLFGEVYDENSFLAGRFFVPKQSSGFYHIVLANIDYTWQEDEVYRVKIHDDRNKIKWMLITFKDLDATFELDINASPTLVDCNPSVNSTIDYTGAITGGIFPFEATWTVTDINTNALLYGPIKSNLIRKGEVPSATVDFPIPYRITLSVFDGCGAFAETSLDVTCGVDNEGNNDVFFEKIPNTQPNNN